MDEAKRTPGPLIGIARTKVPGGYVVRTSPARFGGLHHYQGQIGHGLSWGFWGDDCEVVFDARTSFATAKAAVERAAIAKAESRS